MEPVARDVVPLALIDADRLAYSHRLEQERLDGLLLDGAMRGLRDVAAGRTRDAYEAFAEIRRRRATLVA